MIEDIKPEAIITFTTITTQNTTTTTDRTDTKDKIMVMEQEISGGINKLKSDLKLLLTFNNNIVNASHEIVKEATKSKVENFFKSVSSSLNFINIKNEDSKDKKTEKEKKGKRKNEDVSTATSILNITADISKTLAMTVDVGSSIDIKLPNISMTVMKRKTGTSNSSVWEADTLKVKAMKSLFLTNFHSGKLT